MPTIKINKIQRVTSHIVCLILRFFLKNGTHVLKKFHSQCNTKNIFTVFFFISVIVLLTKYEFHAVD